MFDLENNIVRIARIVCGAETKIVLLEFLVCGACASLLLANLFQLRELQEPHLCAVINCMHTTTQTRTLIHADTSTHTAQKQSDGEVKCVTRECSSFILHHVACNKLQHICTYPSTSRVHTGVLFQNRRIHTNTIRTSAG